jgi:hypothetical protein
MRKAFKVATVFTGAAACAGAFAPAAGAATTVRAQQAEPATSHWNCAIGPRTKAAVFVWPSDTHHGPTCVGDANENNQATSLGTYYNSYCPGNNYGYVFTSLAGVSYRLHPGETRHSIYVNVPRVLISWFSGNDNCAT